MTIIEILKQASLDLNSSFKKSKELSHAGEKGRAREIALIDFFKQRLPSSYSVGTGIIVDSLNNKSRQADIIIFHSLSSPLLYREGTFIDTNPGIFFIESVASVISVKSFLNKKNLEDSIENIISCKKLRKFYSEQSDIIKENKVLPAAYPPYGSVIAYDGIDPEKLMKYLNAIFANHSSEDWPLLPETIFVLDKYFIQTPASYLRLEIPEKASDIIPVLWATLEDKDSPIFPQFYEQIYEGIISSPILKVNIEQYTGPTNNKTLMSVIGKKIGGKEVVEGNMKVSEIPAANKSIANSGAGR